MKEFVSYPIAIRMKKIDFDVPCLAYYNINYNAFTNTNEGELKFPTDISCLESQKSLSFILGFNKILAATWQSAFIWLTPQIDNQFKVCLGENGWYIYNLENEVFEGEKALEKLIEIVEQKQKKNGNRG